MGDLDDVGNIPSIPCLSPRTDDMFSSLSPKTSESRDDEKVNFMILHTNKKPKRSIDEFGDEKKKEKEPKPVLQRSISDEAGIPMMTPSTEMEFPDGQAPGGTFTNAVISSIPHENEIK